MRREQIIQELDQFVAARRLDEALNLFAEGARNGATMKAHGILRRKWNGDSIHDERFYISGFDSRLALTTRLHSITPGETVYHRQMPIDITVKRSVPVERITERIVEVPVEIEKIVHVMKPVGKIVQRITEVAVPVERVVRVLKPVERIVEICSPDMA
jgi:hypothetical protein